MILKNALVSVVSIILMGTVLRAQETAKEQPAGLPGYLELTPHLGTGGQPTAAGFRALVDKGYRAVINLRTAGEGVDLEAEEKAVTDLGLEYYNVPVTGKEPRDDQAEAFLKVMGDLKEEKVFVHCATANRVGSLILIQRVLQDGIDQEKAEQEAAQIGLRSENLLKFARDFISRRR